MDIATIIENHRRHMLGLVSEQDYESEQELGEARSALAIAHDRATTKTLLDVYRTAQSANGELKPLGQAALTAPPPKAVSSRQIKPGSKRAKERAAKAKVTRQANLAAKAAAAQGNSVPPVANASGTTGDAA
jgi:hypothetical protein